MVRIYGRNNLAWRGNKLYRHNRGASIVTIEPDQHYPQMWRVRRPDGSLSDMVNRTRAKDAAVAWALAILKGEGTSVGDGRSD